jgi:hypothetical protein
MIVAEEFKTTRAISSPAQGEGRDRSAKIRFQSGKSVYRPVATFSRVIMVIKGRIVLTTSKKAAVVVWSICLTLTRRT